jgi:hypothetical protein
VWYQCNTTVGGLRVAWEVGHSALERRPGA